MGDEGSRLDARDTYEAMAPAYDAFTADHDYELWWTMLLSLAGEHGLTGDTALDVGCGTGKSVLPLLERNWKVTACDVSPAMVELARSKLGDRVPVEVADMRSLPWFGDFDLVCCLGDVVNYLLSPTELREALRGLAANLAPGGILLFDANTLTTYRTFFGEHAEQEMDGGRVMVWDGRSGKEASPGEIIEGSFEVRGPSLGGGPQVAPVVHRQRHHPEEEIRAAIAAADLDLHDADLDLCAVYGQDTAAVPDRPLDEDVHTKAVYVVRRSPGSESDDGDAKGCRR